MNSKQWMTGGIMGTALALSSTLAWGALVAQQSTSDPTQLIVSGNPLSPTTSTNVTSQGLYDGTHAANYTQDSSALAYNNSSLLTPNLGMFNLWLYTGSDWTGTSNPSAPRFLIGEGANHWEANSFSVFRETDGQLKFIRRVSGDANEVSCAIPSTWKAGEWHNIGISWAQGDNQRIYLDGTEINAVNCGVSLTAGSTLYLGKNVGGQDWSVGGMIYKFTLYNDVDNAATVMAAAAASAPSPIPEPAALGLLALGAALTAARRRR